MDHNRIRNRTFFILAVVIACVLGLTGFPKNVTQLKANLASRIQLGLDLKGGTHMVLQVHVDDAVQVTTDQALERLRDEMATRSISYGSIERKGISSILINGVPDEKSGDLDALVAQQFSSWTLQRVPGQLTARMVNMKVSEVNTIRNQALDQARETIRRRVDALGLVGPEVADYGQGDFELVIQLPGVSDATRVRNIIQATAMLELKIVRGGPYSARETALSSFGGVLPPGTELIPGSPDSSSSATTGGQVFYLLNQVAAVTGRDLTGAQPASGRNGQPSVNFTLSRDGAVRFGEVTSKNIGKQLAIVLDNRVVSAPVIQSQITDSGEITGSFTPQQTSDLALMLRSGALPASITYLNENTVGPSLGADSIRAGIVACVVGFLAVIIFMLVYYRGAGINADVALVLNLVILMAALAYFGAVLTLPGIAGVILTVGMGVDSNVLIFERIREELRHGKAAGAAVAAGFEHAFRTIIDTHVTTVAAAAILFAFGTGPIRGFAVTLTIGLIANLFTSVYVSRTIFDYVLTRRQKGEALSV
ncbi:MAG: protein translocase subunit SecD [Acidobacteria bacterium]|nr:MAG: protein translocase subunit SecD [Acidobacteriota bacterium]